MNDKQKNTVDRIVKRIEKLNGKQKVTVFNIRKGHINLIVYNVRDNVDFIRTTTYCDLDVNTKGNVVKGFLDELRPKENVEYPYMNL